MRLRRRRDTYSSQTGHQVEIEVAVIVRVAREIDVMVQVSAAAAAFAAKACAASTAVNRRPFIIEIYVSSVRTSMYRKIL